MNVIGLGFMVFFVLYNTFILVFSLTAYSEMIEEKSIRKYFPEMKLSFDFVVYWVCLIILWLTFNYFLAKFLTEVLLAFEIHSLTLFHSIMVVYYVLTLPITRNVYSLLFSK